MKIDAKHIEEIWGPRCDQYEAGCGCCDMWVMWDEIERLRVDLADADRTVSEAWADCHALRGLLREARDDLIHNPGPYYSNEERIARIDAALADQPAGGDCPHCNGRGIIEQDCDWCDGHGNYTPDKSTPRAE